MIDFYHTFQRTYNPCSPTLLSYATTTRWCEPRSPLGMFLQSACNLCSWASWRSLLSRGTSITFGRLGQGLVQYRILRQPALVSTGIVTLAKDLATLHPARRLLTGTQTVHSPSGGVAVVRLVQWFIPQTVNRILADVIART
jgi:hypothetical protein